MLIWASVRRTSAIAAYFILFTLTAGLAGTMISLNQLLVVIPVRAGAALLGGYIAFRIGSQLLAPEILVRLLSLALVVASVKDILT